MIAEEELLKSVVNHAAMRAARRLSSQEIALISHHLLQQQQHASAKDIGTGVLLRLAARASPYDANVLGVIEARRHAIRRRIESTFPEILGRVDAFNRLEVPTPLIISCEKYLQKAKEAASEFKSVYFGLDPIIVTGNPNIQAETFYEGILTLPLSDTYEALPYKVFETFIFLDSIGTTHGILKIDDDLRLTCRDVLIPELVRSTFRGQDYMGVALDSVFHDRAWHHGKCTTDVTPLYGKPFLAPWARGALYFLSAAALSLLCAHYLRFPASLAGEIYEDKAVGDTLFQLGIRVTHRPLEPILNISTDAPERFDLAPQEAHA